MGHAQCGVQDVLGQGGHQRGGRGVGVLAAEQVDGSPPTDQVSDVGGRPGDEPALSASEREVLEFHRAVAPLAAPLGRSSIITYSTSLTPLGVATALFDVGRLEEALPYFERARRLDPRSPMRAYAEVLAALFDARELWGDAADPKLKVSIEAWDPYLEPA